MSPQGATTAEISIPLRVASGAVGRDEPISTGIPFARGSLRDASGLLLVDGHGSAVDSQWQVLSRWPEGSVRWLLLDLLRRGEAETGTELRVVQAGRAFREASSRAVVTEGERALEITTACRFSLERERFSVSAMFPSGESREGVHLTCELTDARGRVCAARVRAIESEVVGPVRTTFRILGGFPRSPGAPRLEFEARVSFFTGTGLVRVDFTLRNSRAARHRGGLWDLGDPGSAFFRDVSLLVRGPASHGAKITWRAEPGRPVDGAGEPVEIFQASSGGENWRSRNHVNRSGEVPLLFRGYRIKEGKRELAGLRASPIVALSTPSLRISAAVPRFWEQFPKAIAAQDGLVRIGLFPREQGDLFELQGGEQKTLTTYLLFEHSPPGDGLSLEWAHAPTLLAVEPRYLSACGAMGSFLPFDEDPHEDYLTLMESCISGPESFYRKREVIDEYGWRHFGEVYADHENLHYDGDLPVVSHYNNQYDALQGLLLHFGRSGKQEWFELAQDLANHVIDIDVYHTREDKAAYNGGLFWHTDHYAGAGLATHRTYSGDHPLVKAGKPYGGGPSNEHNYTSGLLLFHFLTGSPLARDAVRTLAEWVLDMDEGGKSPLGFLDPGPTGRASSTAERSYHGPGRGAGNSVNALLDAFRLTSERRYLEKAEELVRRSIHPADDIAGRGLEDLEGRWSYVVFLQVLGKYLDLKAEIDERDSMYEYARMSLTHYALWMLEKEVPYMQVLDRVEYPTETWPAHDVRKSVVFDHAARFGPPEHRDSFLKKAEFFFRECMAGLSKFPSRTCTRPLAILLGNGTYRGYCMRRRPKAEPPGPSDVDFGRPDPFRGQEDRVKDLLRTGRGRTRLAMALLRPTFAVHVLSHLIRRLRKRVRP